MHDTFASGGRVGRDLAAVDWSATPLGEPDQWARSLQAVVRLVLSSRYSMWMAWGPELTFFCNDSYRRDTLGAKYPWALGRPASEVWSEVWSDVEHRVERVLSTGSATWDEKLLLFLERNGYREETYHTFSYSPVADDDGSVAGRLCVVSEDTDEVIARRRMGALRDVAARASSQLSEEETVAAFSRALADSSLDVPFHLVYLDDGEGRYRLAARGGFHEPHPAAPAVLDPHAEGSPWPPPPGVGDLPLVVDRIDQVHWGLPAGGWPAPPNRAAVLAIRGAQGAPYGFMVVGLNPFRPFDDGYADFLGLVGGQLGAAISDARAYEQERERADSLMRLDQAKTDFFTNISHEFRTPLTLLLGPVEDALGDASVPLPPPHRHRLEVVQRNGLRMLKLVNGLLDFSRLESGRADAAFEPVDLARLTRELVSMFESSAERLGLRLVVDCPALAAPVHVDPELWGKALLNLVSNALKFTLEGEVVVTLRAVGDRAVLVVRDTGSGIAPDQLTYVFERFHRVRDVRSRTHEGSGIGLALVAEVAKLHGGDVGVTSVLGEGSTFTLRIPFGREHLPDDRILATSGRGVSEHVLEGFLNESEQLSTPLPPTVTAVPVGADGEIPAERPVVLVVDDNADVRRYVVDLLSDRYDVLTATDGAAGLEVAFAARPDLVLTDVMMPVLDGFGLLAALRDDPRTVGTPVVMLSARGGNADASEGLEAGADDYLVKPFTARELRARIHANLELERARRTREELERSQALLDQAQRLARVGSWSVEPESGRVQASDELLRVLDCELHELEGQPGTFLVARAHPEDRPLLQAVVADARPGEDFGLEARLLRPDGSELIASVRGTARVTHEGRLELRGSLQDITSARQTAESLALAHATAEVAAREHEIADELQRNLLPQEAYELPGLEVATYYRAGVAGTQVGGDWFDVIPLGAGRVALAVGDGMGRGVRAPAVMGQVRSAMRAYALLGLPPAELLTSVDSLVCDLFPDQIITCAYAVLDPAAGTVELANAGHVPPLVARPDGTADRLGEDAQPPLGLGRVRPSWATTSLGPDDVLLLYTDGLVERRDQDPDTGITRLANVLGEHRELPLADVPAALVRVCLPEGPDDDVAVLAARWSDASDG